MARFNLPFFGRKEQLDSPQSKKRDMPDGVWLKCQSCADMLTKSDLVENLMVCTSCGHHFELPRHDRIAMLAEEGSFEEWDTTLSSIDVLEFTGEDAYHEKLKQNMEKTGEHDAITCGKALIGPHAVGLGVMDFRFLGASMGSVVGEKVTRLFEKSQEARMPVVLCCASGGARMYEGMFSLMQMAKTSGAISRHSQAGLAYIPILTHPTMAGVMASFATLGDMILAEPDALIGFAGPRVIKETTQSELPPGFQRSEFLMGRGLIDQVVERKQLKARLVQLLNYVNVAA